MKQTYSQIPAACFNFNALQAMRIMQDVEMKVAGIENIIALGIKYSKEPYVVKIHNLQGMIEDNRDAIEFMIGTKLVNEILKFR